MTYNYFRIINNVINDLSLFIIQKRVKCKNNNDLYSYIFFLDNKFYDIDELNNILFIKESTYKSPSLLETLFDFKEKTDSPSCMPCFYWYARFMFCTKWENADKGYGMEHSSWRQ